MALNVKKSPLSLDSLPEIFVSSKALSSAVSKAVKAGRLRKIGSRLYTRNKTEAPEQIVRRNWHSLLKDYFPDALISDRTALENRPAPDGSVFIISSGTRPVILPGITFRPRKGHSPLQSDPLFLGNIRLCSAPRAGWRTSGLRASGQPRWHELYPNRNWKSASTACCAKAVRGRSTDCGMMPARSARNSACQRNSARLMN